MPSGKITGAFSSEAVEGFGIKFPHGTKGANATAVPPAPNSFKKSLLDSGFVFLLSCSDIQALVLAKLFINLVSFRHRNFDFLCGK